jgi:hypothetical protein
MQNQTGGIFELNDDELSLASGGKLLEFQMNGISVLISDNGGGHGTVNVGTCYKGECHYFGGGHW